MRIKFSLLTFLILSINSLLFAQGGWNMGYLKIGDITKDDVGKTFRIDFKSEKLNGDDDAFIRSYFSTKDSNFLSIDNTKIEFVEKRKIYADAGYYEDQFLVCKKCNTTLRVLDMLLLEIRENTLVFMADFEIEINKADTINFKKEVEVVKNELEGLIFLNSKF